MSSDGEGFLSIDFDKKDELPKDIIKNLIEDIKNCDFICDEIDFIEKDKSLNIMFSSRGDIEGCWDWFEYLMQEGDINEKKIQLLFNSEFYGRARVLGEDYSRKITKDKKQKSLKKYNLDFSSIPDAVLMATKNLNFKKGKSINVGNDVRIDLIDILEDKEKQLLLIRVLGVIECLLLFERKKNEKYFETILEKLDEYYETGFPRSVKEVLEKFELKYDPDEEFEGEASACDIYELLYDMLCDNEEAYSLEYVKD